METLFFSRETSACLQVPQVLPPFRSFAKVTEKLVMICKNTDNDESQRPAINKYHKKIPKFVFKKQHVLPKLRQSAEQKVVQSIVQNQRELTREVREWENRQKQMKQEGFEFSALLVDISVQDHPVTSKENKIISESKALREQESFQAEYMAFRHGIENLVTAPKVTLTSNSQSNFEISSLDSIESRDASLDLVWPVVYQIRPRHPLISETIPSSIQVMSATSIKSPLIQVTRCSALPKIPKSTDPENEKAQQLMASDPTQAGSQQPGDRSLSKSRELSEIQEPDLGDKQVGKDLGERSIRCEQTAPISQNVSKKKIKVASRKSTFSRCNILRDWKKCDASPVSPAQHSPIKINRKIFKGSSPWFGSSPAHLGSKLKLVLSKELKKEIRTGRPEVMIRYPL